jgi:plastocyanin
VKTFAPIRRTVSVALAALVLLPMAAARPALAASNDAGDAATSGPIYRVEIHNFAFSPNTLTVPKGARIVWTNRDDEPHTIVSAAGAFKASQALDTDDSFATTLDKPGAYAYFCGIHPMMVGKIIVR